jgi:hypothetical protein
MLPLRVEDCFTSFNTLQPSVLPTLEFMQNRHRDPYNAPNQSSARDLLWLLDEFDRGRFSPVHPH